MAGALFLGGFWPAGRMALTLKHRGYMTTGKFGAYSKLTLSIFTLALFAVAWDGIGKAQDQDTTSRRFWPPNFRPAATRPAPAPKTSRYKRATPALPKNDLAPGSLPEAVVGVTVWRMRPSRNTDDARILVKKSGKNWTPERVEADTKFSEGQALRLSVEIPRTGYLYVVDREQ